MAKQKKDELPILMCGDMICAYMDGRKTKTRRIVKFNHKPWLEPLPHVEYARDGMPIWWDSPPTDEIRNSDYYDSGYPCPYGKVGDKLWFKESILYSKEHDNFYYAADKKGLGNEFWSGRKKKSVPSIFMPRAASRFNPKILSIKVERVQDISEEDAVAEGVDLISIGGVSAVDVYQGLWERINGKVSWESNPWVWVIEFERYKPHFRKGSNG